MFVLWKRNLLVTYILLNKYAKDLVAVQKYETKSMPWRNSRFKEGTITWWGSHIQARCKQNWMDRFGEITQGFNGPERLLSRGKMRKTGWSVRSMEMTLQSYGYAAYTWWTTGDRASMNKAEPGNTLDSGWQAYVVFSVPLRCIFIVSRLILHYF